ncbi:translation initiation factor eIF4e [Jaminaea rosea]|uniref:Translation initiation factor eIF4e n=1 Tax=Jaminaea rosea TaxID=1569628 RepID=A0A316UYK0_9BASI|nr:translation initiation factor eIF4e [Jaminaea rosea]PWN30292.1 translation initiation factor eIF4e [Jaminaea rosea]
MSVSAATPRDDDVAAPAPVDANTPAGAGAGLAHVGLVTPSSATPSLASPATSVAATRGSSPASSPALSATHVKGDGAGSASSGKTASSSSKKPPTLSDIAARLKLDGKDTPEKDSSHLDVNAPQRGRLGLAGRLNSSSSDAGASPAAPSVTSDNEGDSVAQTSPQALVLGMPPNSGDSASASTSPSIPSTSLPSTTSEATQLSSTTTATTAASSTSEQKSKGIPSLDDIRERMAKKGHSSPAKSVASWDEPFEKKGSLWDRADPNAGKSDGVGGSHPFSSSPTKSPTRSPKTRTTPMLGSTSAATKTSPTMPPPVSTAPLSHRSNAAAGPSKPPSSAQRPVPTGHHPLQHKWTVYFDSKSPASAPTHHTISGTEHGWDVYDPRASSAAPPSATLKSSSATPGADSWEAALKVLGAYRTVESFMGVFTTIKRPSQLDLHSNYHLFKNGIKPMWEDPANANGGKWTISLSRSATNPALLDRSWMWLVLALIGEELDTEDEITGAVFSSRPKANRISLWLRDRGNVERVNSIGRKLVDLLEVEKEPGVSMDFSAVNAATSGFARGSAGRSGAGGYWSFSNPGKGGPDGSAAASSSGGTAAAGRPAARPTGGSFSGGTSGGFGLGVPIGRTGAGGSRR